MTKQDLIKKTLFENVMSSGGLDSYSNYIGSDWAGWLCGLTKTRDSEVLTQSNFDVALERLGGEIEGQVEVRSCNHWACGHFDQIMVKADSPQVDRLLEIINELDNYPVLDDSDFSERENEERTDWAEQSKDSIARVLVKIFGLPEEMANEKEMLELGFELQMTHQYDNGNDSSLYDNPYHCDKMDDRDLERYERALTDRDTADHLGQNPAYDLILACFGLQNPKVN